MIALGLNCTLKRSPETSNTEALVQVLLETLAERGAQTEMVRVVDHVVEPGVESHALSDTDEWPALHEKVVSADILIVATPTWLGQQSSISTRVLERMDALLSETKEDGRPIACDRPSGSVSASDWLLCAMHRDLLKTPDAAVLDGAVQLASACAPTTSNRHVPNR